MKAHSFTPNFLFSRAGALLIAFAFAEPVSAVTVAYWNSQSGGNSLTDQTANGNDLTGSGGLTTSSVNVAPNPIPNPDSSISGGAGSIFIGSNFSNAPSIDGTDFQMTSSSSFTLEGWFQISTGGVTQYIASDRHQNNSYRGWFVNVGSNDKLQFYSNSGGTASSVTSDSIIVGTGSHHFAAVWDHTAGTTGQMTLYVDGILQGAGATDHAVGSYTVTDLSIGGRSTSGSTYNDDILVNGSRLDELRFSDQALAPTEFLNYVPEPSTALLGLICLMALFRRRRH